MELFSQITTLSNHMVMQISHESGITDADRNSRMFTFFFFFFWSGEPFYIIVQKDNNQKNNISLWIPFVELQIEVYEDHKDYIVP